MSSLRERNKVSKRKRILAVARRQFGELGFEATTFRSIATEAGVGLGTVHLYAESKQALLHEVWREDTMPVFDRAVKDAMAKPLVAGALSLFTPLLLAYAEEPGLARVVIKELPWLEGRAAERHQPDLQRLWAALTALVTEGQTRGELVSRVEPTLAVSVLLSLYYASCLDLVVPSGTREVQRVVDRLRARLELVCTGWEATNENRHRGRGDRRANAGGGTSAARPRGSNSRKTR